MKQIKNKEICKCGHEKKQHKPCINTGELECYAKKLEEYCPCLKFSPKRVKKEKIGHICMQDFTYINEDRPRKVRTCNVCGKTETPKIEKLKKQGNAGWYSEIEMGDTINEIIARVNDLTD